MKDQASTTLYHAAREWLTTKQANKICWLVERAEQFELREHTRVFIDKIDNLGRFASVTIRWERTDCHPHSPRMVVCSGGYNFHIMRGGASKLTMNYGLYGDRTDLSVVARLYNSTTFHYRPSKEVIAARCAKAREALKRSKGTDLSAGQGIRPPEHL